MESGKHYNYFRDYDPTIGRYLESDPIGLSGGSSTYGYVGGQPLTSFDELGLAQCTYEIATHTLSCRPNNPGFVGPPLGTSNAFSGTGVCRNNNECIERRKEGPVPPGDYDLVREPTKRDHWLLKPGLWDRLRCQTARFEKLGGQVGRCGFFLHPGSTSYGCISVRDPFAPFQDLLTNDGPNTLKVVP